MVQNTSANLNAGVRIDFMASGNTNRVAYIKGVNVSGGGGATDLIFATNNDFAAPVDALKIDSVGNVTALTGNIIQGTAAKGVNFTANTPQAGMTSQLLNWYEEGVSTVTLAFGGGSTGIVYSNQQCRYTRIGNRVMIQIGLAISNKGSSTGAATISGLPFTSKNIGYGSNLFAVNAQNMAGSTGVIFALLPENSSTIALKNINAGGNVNVDFTDAAWGAGSYVTISGQYLVA
jgi:hypothetical protein